MTDWINDHAAHLRHKLVFPDCEDCQRDRPRAKPATDAWGGPELTLLGQPRKRKARPKKEEAYHNGKRRARRTERPHGGHGEGEE